MAILDCWDMAGTWQHWTVGTWWGHGNTGLWGHGGDMGTLDCGGHGNTGLWGHGGEMATLDCGDMVGKWQHWTVGPWQYMYMHMHWTHAHWTVGTWQHMYWTVGTQNRYLFPEIHYLLIKFCQNNFFVNYFANLYFVT